MKNLFGKKNPNVHQPIVDNTNPIPPSGGSGIKETETHEIIVPLSAVEKFMESEPQWKSYNGNSCGDVTNFLNENKVDPLFMVPGENGQIRVFYKA